MKTQHSQKEKKKILKVKNMANIKLTERAGRQNWRNLKGRIKTDGTYRKSNYLGISEWKKHSMRGGNYRTNNSQRFHRTQRNKPVTERIRKLPNTVNTGSQADGMDFWELLLSHFSCSDCVTPWTVPGPSVHGILQARILEWVAVLFSRGPFGPRDRTQVSLCLLQW